MPTFINAYYETTFDNDKCSNSWNNFDFHTLHLPYFHSFQILIFKKIIVIYTKLNNLNNNTLYGYLNLVYKTCITSLCHIYIFNKTGICVKSYNSNKPFVSTHIYFFNKYRLYIYSFNLINFSHVFRTEWSSVHELVTLFCYSPC